MNASIARRKVITLIRITKKRSKKLGLSLAIFTFVAKAKKEALGNSRFIKTSKTRKTSKNGENGKNKNKDENLEINLI